MEDDVSEPLTITDILTACSRMSADDRARIEMAWRIAERAHAGRIRLSGETQLQHLASVSLSLAQAGADAQTVTAALLQDCMQHAQISGEELEAHFGNEVRFIVEGIARLGEAKFNGDGAYAEYLRGLFHTASGDMRILFVKLYDRMHNMRSNHLHAEDRKLRKALESMHVYAPIAGSLGMGQVKRELEDLAFQFVQPNDHAEAQHIREKIVEDRTPFAYAIAHALEDVCSQQGVPLLRISVLTKGVYRLWTKIKSIGTPSQVEDACSVRIVVPNVTDCYRMLGVVHSTLHAVPGRVRDYIASPKPNGYQGIHTSIYIGASVIEVQVCTPEMDAQSRNGAIVASRQASQWLNDVSDLCAALVASRPTDLAHHTKHDFLGCRICVFTRQGDAIYLPPGACAIDFAYAVHPVVGDHVVAVQVNDTLADPTTILQQGDVVDVRTDSSVKPCPQWLSFVKTTRAQMHIREMLVHAA